MTSIDGSVPRLESDRGAVRGLVDRVTYPAEHPFSTLAAYYTLLARAAPNVVGVRVH